MHIYVLQNGLFRCSPSHTSHVARRLFFFDFSSFCFFFLFSFFFFLRLLEHRRQLEIEHISSVEGISPLKQQEQQAPPATTSARRLSRPRTDGRRRALTRSHAHTLTRSHAHTLTRSHARTLTRSHARTHIGRHYHNHATTQRHHMQLVQWGVLQELVPYPQKEM